MKTVEKYQELKEQHAAITIEINKRQGILIRVMEELEEEFKVSTLDEAKKLLNKIENENKKATGEATYRGPIRAPLAGSPAFVFVFVLILCLI